MINRLQNPTLKELQAKAVQLHRWLSVVTNVRDRIKIHDMQFRLEAKIRGVRRVVR